MKPSIRLVCGVVAPCMLLSTVAWGATEAEKLAAIRNGLAHLAATQQPGGYWDYTLGPYQEATTGAAAFAFLSQESKWTPGTEAQNTVVVDKALAFLLANATKVAVSTRNDGAPICPGVSPCPAVYWYGSGETTYTTGLVAPAIALYGAKKGAAAVATTVGPLANMTWAEIAQAITNTFAAGQSTALNGAMRGGWRYFPGTGDSDSSTTQWAVISMLYSSTLGAVTPAVVKTDLLAWLAVVQDPNGSVCYQPGGYSWCDHSDTGGWLVAKKFAGAGLDAPTQLALNFLKQNWTESANNLWFGNFGHPYAMWSVYKGLETNIGLNDNSHIGPPLKTDCGAARSAMPLSGVCNWWEDYNEFLVVTANPNGSWTGSDYWTDPLSTAFFVNILGATIIPANQPPVAKCKNVTVAANASCKAAASVDDGSYDPDSGDTIELSQTPPGPYSLGPNPVTLTVTDNHGASSSCTATVTVVDQTPPTVTSSTSTVSLWPPQHDLFNVGLSGSSTDNCTATPVMTVKVYGNEDDETPTGDGNFSPDAKNLALGSLLLRSERIGDASGRIYLIVASAQDGAGNTAASCSTVVVAKSQSSTDRSAVAAAAAAARSYCAAHNGAPPAAYFVVGDGAVIGPKQ